MFVSLFSVKIIGLQLFGVLQLAFFNLADNQYVNLYLSPLLDWRYINGFNINLENGSIVPVRIQSLRYKSSFISNINIMFLILLGQLMISGFIMILAKRVSFLSKINRLFFQQVFLTLFLFNSFNISFSAALHFKYAKPKDTKYY